MSETLQAIDEYVSSDVKDGACRVCGVPLFGDDGAPTDGRAHDILCPLPLLITARLALAQLQQERDALRDALSSIAHNSCCCQEATMIARAALATSQKGA